MTATKTRAGLPPSLDDIGLEGPRRKSRLPEVALGSVAYTHLTLPTNREV